MIRVPFKMSVQLYWLIVFIDLAAILLGYKWLHAFAKPFLMPTLAILLYSIDSYVPGKKLILTGLLFSWLGDVFLLVESQNDLFFIFGLASFFVTHICYVIYFLSVRSGNPSLLKKQPVFILFTLSYGAGLVWVLLPFLGDLKIPVMLYAAIICSMLLCSVHVYLKVKSPSNNYFITGAALFVLSDSLLAINKFYHPFPLAGIAIMLTYCAAQYFIVRGFIDLGRMKEDE